MSLKERFCYVCGESLGEIDARNYDRRDTCGKLSCDREIREEDREHREEAHRDLDERMGWS